MDILEILDTSKRIEIWQSVLSYTTNIDREVLFTNNTEQ